MDPGCLGTPEGCDPEVSGRVFLTSKPPVSVFAPSLASHGSGAALGAGMWPVDQPPAAAAPCQVHPGL